MLEINTLSQQFFEHQFTTSCRGYLTSRFGIDLAGHEDIRPGQAHAGWTNLVNHLRRHSVGDDAMLAAGVAKTASTGRLIDTFRDRVTFPITRLGRTGDDVEILGFVARRHPRHNAEKDGPKYLNTAETPLFHKGAQLFGALDQLVRSRRDPRRRRRPHRRDRRHAGQRRTLHRCRPARNVADRRAGRLSWRARP